MSHLDGKGKLPRWNSLRTKVAGINNINTLQKMMEELEITLEEVTSRREETCECYYQHMQACNLACKVSSAIRKIEVKLSNLRRVKSDSFELNSWYTDCRFGEGNYIYPYRITTTGRVVALCVYPSRSGWFVKLLYMDSADLKSASRLEVIVKIGNLERLRRWIEKRWFKQGPRQIVPAKTIHLRDKDGDFKNLEVIIEYGSS